MTLKPIYLVGDPINFCQLSAFDPLKQGLYDRLDFLRAGLVNIFDNKDNAKEFYKTCQWPVSKMV